jgi:hypothetical protein
VNIRYKLLLAFAVVLVLKRWPTTSTPHSRISRSS